MKKHKLAYSNQDNQSGFTIIECLLAIIIVGILMTAIAPVLAISVATRLQARRVELATQAAKTYIDAVRSGAIAAPNKTIYLTEAQLAGTGTGNDRRTFSATAAPLATQLPATCVGGTTPNPATYPYCLNSTTASLYCVDNDGGGCTSSSSKDFIVQAFRSTTVTAGPGDDSAKGYLLGVRVYRADAFRESTPALIRTDAFSTTVSDRKKKTQGTVAGGLGGRKNPLVETTTEIIGNGTTYQNFCDRYGGC